MKLGERAQIAIGVEDLASARLFYQELGFQLLAENDVP